MILEGLNGKAIEHSLRFDFKASDKQAEYEALITGLQLAKKTGADSFIMKSNS